jgi:biopolymer transport protein ExbD
MRRLSLGAFLCVGLFLVANAQTPTVELPRNFRNAAPDPRAASASAIVLAIFSENEIYVNGIPTTKDSLGSKIDQLTKGKGDQDRIVYLAAGASVNYGVVADTLAALREPGVGRIGLMVDAADSPGTPKIFQTEIPLPFKRTDDVHKLKPNPLTLVAAISSDRRLTLNHDSAPEPGQLCFDSLKQGLETDPVRLQHWLECLFANRTRQHAYAVGLETRTDLPMASRIEKTVFVKGARSLNYVDILRVIDAVQGAGSHPIGLQIDDLPK